MMEPFDTRKNANNVKIPRGFLFSAAQAAVKKPGVKDMGLIYSDVEAVAAGVFTKNKVKAAPVRLDMKRIRSGRGRAIVVNSGNANACTGDQGMKDAIEMIELPAKLLKIKPSQVYVCSTGVIGTPLPMQKIRPKMNRLVRELGGYSFIDIAEAIMTTDTFPKSVYREITVSGKKVTISACAKGAGMICPDMATMLCFVLTDAAVERNALKSALKDAVDATFNCITVDGDMSTNDTVLAFANGLAGNGMITAGSNNYHIFKKALYEIAHELAEMIVKDGEGATKTVTIEVSGAKSPSDAHKAARAVANSLLVKTAIYGNDANWGRIMAAIGYSGISFRENLIDIAIENLKVVKKGLSTGKDAEAARALHGKHITIKIDLHYGPSSAKALTCDLTEEYVKINAEYRT